MPERNGVTATQVEFIAPDGGVNGVTATQVEFIAPDGGVNGVLAMHVEFIAPPPVSRKVPAIQGRRVAGSNAQGARFLRWGGKVIKEDENFGD
jgi:hypothetical protein